MIRRHRFPPWLQVPAAAGLTVLVLAGCGGGGGGGGGAGGQARLIARGGDSTSNDAGRAGSITVFGDQGVRAGRLSTGDVALALPAIPVPAPTALVLGTGAFPDFASLDGRSGTDQDGVTNNAAIIAGDVVVPAGATFRFDGPTANRRIEASGSIFVAGEISADDTGSAQGGRMRLQTGQSIVVSGRLTSIVDAGGIGGSVNLDARLIALGSGATVDARGGAGSAGAAGGAGGTVALQQFPGAAAPGVLLDAGSRIDVRGGDGAPGGNGGEIEVDYGSLDAPIAIAGDLLASGGTGLGGGGGGGGGPIGVVGDGAIAISSTLDASAGSAVNETGAAGGQIVVESQSGSGVSLVGATVVLDLRGGASGGVTSGTDDAGAGGPLLVQAPNGDIAWFGDIRCEAGGGNGNTSARGGNVTFTAIAGDIEIVGNVTAFGASDPMDPGVVGGDLRVSTDDGSIRFVGDVDLRGGAGAPPAAGPRFTLLCDADQDDIGGPVFYQGTVNVSGGDALQTGEGGKSGGVFILADPNNNEIPAAATGTLGPGSRIVARGGVGMGMPDGTDGLVQLYAAGAFDVGGAAIETATTDID